MFVFCLFIEPLHEKKRFCIQCENKGGYHTADQRLWFRYKDRNTNPLYPQYELSSILPSSMAVHPGFSPTWADTPKTGFLAMRVNTDEDLSNFIAYMRKQRCRPAAR